MASHSQYRVKSPSHGKGQHTGTAKTLVRREDPWGCAVLNILQVLMAREGSLPVLIPVVGE